MIAAMRTRRLRKANASPPIIAIGPGPRPPTPRSFFFVIILPVLIVFRRRFGNRWLRPHGRSRPFRFVLNRRRCEHQSARRALDRLADQVVGDTQLALALLTGKN